jgi:hypothetical protein
VAGVWIFILVGQGLSGNYQATFTWDTPWSPAAGGTSSLYWEKLPCTVKDAVQVTWTNGGATSSATSDLGQDRVVTFGSSGVVFSPASSS